jgi:hypothetical protein
MLNWRHRILFRGTAFAAPARVLCCAGLALVAACAERPGAGQEPAIEMTRDTRSEAHCIRLASENGGYSVDRVLLCRREEGAAAARATLLDIPDPIDAECGAMAAQGPQLREFSWQAYIACVGPRLP